MRVSGVIHIFYIILYCIVDIVIVNLPSSYEGNFVYVSILLYKHISSKQRVFWFTHTAVPFLRVSQYQRDEQTQVVTKSYH